MRLIAQVRELLGFMKPAAPVEVRPKRRREKFELFCDLGTITVPSDYRHETQAGSFMREYRSEFTSCELGNFVPERILSPGERLKVRAMWWPEEMFVRDGEHSGHRFTGPSYDDVWQLMAHEGCVCVGTQGLTLVFAQPHERLWQASKGTVSYLSFARNNRYGCSVLITRPGGDCDLFLSNNSNPILGCTFLLFNEV